MNAVRFSLSFLMGGLLTMDALGYADPEFPYAPAAGNADSTAIAYSDPAFVGWATGVESLEIGQGSDDEQLHDPASVIGPSTGGVSGILVLGRGGQIVLEMNPAIADGPGHDFAVFENAFSDGFLELAFVEVSSDGIHFVRFPAYSQTAAPVGTWGQVQATHVDGLAGKYRAGYGTPFDLAALKAAILAVESGYDQFSPEYRDHLLANGPFLDFDNVRLVRLIDVAGDGTAKDCQGYAIYDPYPTFITAGFDLDALGVLHSVDGSVSFAEWAASHHLSGAVDADHDGDRWKDLLEYHFGTRPDLPDSVPSPRIYRDSESRVVIEVTVNPDARGDLLVEFSPDGTTWETKGIEPVPQTEGLLFLEVPAGEAALFRFKANPPTETGQ